MTCCRPSFLECGPDGVVYVTAYDGDGNLLSAIAKSGPNEGAAVAIDRADLKPCGAVSSPEIGYLAGPGGSGSASVFLAQSRHWIVTDGPTGQEEDWCILLDTNGAAQWHQRA